MNSRKVISILTIGILLFIFYPNVHPVFASESDWSRPRPTTNRSYYEKVANSFYDDNAAVGLGVNIFQYYGGPTFDDYLYFGVSVLSNTHKQINYESSVTLIFQMYIKVK